MTKKAAVDMTMTMSAILAVAIQVFLFVSYWNYMNRMRDEGCKCALTKSFAMVRKTFVQVVILYLATFLLILFFKALPLELILAANLVLCVMSLVLSVFVVKWWIEMYGVSCKCSEAWEKYVWAGLSAYHIASVAVGLISLLLAAVA